MEQVSYNRLSELTGKSYRTIKGRLVKAGIESTGKVGNAFLFDSEEALPVLYLLSDKSEAPDLQMERALLAREQKLKLRRQNKIADGKIAPVDQLTAALSSVISQQVAILEAIPMNVKRSYPAITARELEIIKKEIAKCRNLAAGVTLEINN